MVPKGVDEIGGISSNSTIPLIPSGKDIKPNEYSKYGPTDVSVEQG
jgi:hypothetical protein